MDFKKIISATEIEVGDIISVQGNKGRVLKIKNKIEPDPIEKDRFNTYNIVPCRFFKVKFFPETGLKKTIYDNAWYGGNHRAKYYCYKRTTQSK